MSYLLSPEAEGDLLDIYDYSLQEWGEAQADLYLGGLYDAFIHAARFPKKGRLRVDLGLDVRSVLYRSHIIFHAEVSDGIAVVRVLHQSRDLESEFSG